MSKNEPIPLTDYKFQGDRLKGVIRRKGRNVNVITSPIISIDNRVVETMHGTYILTERKDFNKLIPAAAADLGQPWVNLNAVKGEVSE